MSRATTKFGDYSVHIEWQTHKSGAYQFKTAKKDHKKVGELRKESGLHANLVFIMERRAEDLVFSKERWGIPRTLLTVMRCLGSPKVEIWVSNGDRYRISYADLDAKKFDIKDNPKMVSLVFVKFEDFEFEKGEADSIATSMKVGKWK